MVRRITRIVPDPRRAGLAKVEVDGHPAFTFQLEPGVSDQRFGMVLLEQAEVPQLIARIGA